ncbi:sigma-70 family RNA polymerase sigma factor [Paenibacillus psychroresistens]|uniref:Sigma-70 family RNA polymerase sigma factor n=1 Tax=Paenibacillus psychroresistens TaxID=1778678 RepID=A0A6B8REM4_9BACL|nr:sigma-70 family RNA polymerase sigma factor [Paenibacillus psychroresistens]QGQ94619.1 sigma-70 family RNA polymerase sigma factor [Paenibacillus psychroresistens]
MNERVEDLQLMKLIALKDAPALEQLYDRYEKAIYCFAHRIVNDVMMAEEVVQELFMRIWNFAERYESTQGKLSTWMFTLTRNIAIDILRKKQNRVQKQVAEQQQLNAIPDSGKAVEDEVENNWIGDEVRQAMKALNEDQQKVVEWIYYQGLTQQEVAERHAIPLGTVKSRVRLAMKQLKQRLANVVERGVTHE